MKLLPIILLLLFSLPLFSQKDRVNYFEIDRYVQTVKFASPAVLAQKLTSPYTTELEKVRAIFRWIAENIDYRTHFIPNKKKRIILNELPDDTGALKPLDERVAESVLEKGTAVCDGYARLFKTLCDYAGIHAELVTGYARTNAYRQNQRFRSNHTWNAVLIDSVWKLLDVTWASGYLSWHGNDYIRQFGEEYFLAAPEEFIREHYPDDIRWTLLHEAPAIAEFRNSPYKQKSFIKYSITGFRPAKGILDASVGDTLQLEIDVADPGRDERIGNDPFLDTSIYNSTISALLVATGREGNKLSYTYHVSSPHVQWLYVLYNNDVVLRYRLNAKNRNSIAVIGTD